MLTLKPHVSRSAPPTPYRNEVAEKKLMAIANCPVCKDVRLTPNELEPNLNASTCQKCGGWWIDSKNYWSWLETRPGHRSELPTTASLDLTTQQPVVDSGPGKFCPGCGRFLARVKPGHGLAFHLNRCGGCGGIWLDAHEWENLHAVGLHDDIHFIFSDAWQAEVAKATRVQQHEQLLADKLGEEALAEIKRVKTWLDGHPNKAELYAYLLGPKDLGPSKR